MKATNFLLLLSIQAPATLADSSSKLLLSFVDASKLLQDTVPFLVSPFEPAAIHNYWANESSLCEAMSTKQLNDNVRPCPYFSSGLVNLPSSATPQSPLAAAVCTSTTAPLKFDDGPCRCSTTGLISRDQNQMCCVALCCYH